MVLNASEAKAFYDRFGKKQDTQSFYEDLATDDLIAHAGFDETHKLFEFGCGTGRFAEKLLTEYLPASAVYIGYDLSSTMVGLAQQRLAVFKGRAQVLQSDGAMHFPIADRSVDRVVSTYVLDLLSEADIKAFFFEAHRVLHREGKVCLVGLTNGTRFVSRLVSSIWYLIFRMRASLVGGCRPVQLMDYLGPSYWHLEYRNIVSSFFVPSEILVATPRELNPSGQQI